MAKAQATQTVTLSEIKSMISEYSDPRHYQITDNVKYIDEKNLKCDSMFSVWDLDNLEAPVAQIMSYSGDQTAGKGVVFIDKVNNIKYVSDDSLRSQGLELSTVFSALGM